MDVHPPLDMVFNVFMDHSYWSPDDSSPKSTGHRFASSFSEADALNSSISVSEARSWAWVDCATVRASELHFEPSIFYLCHAYVLTMYVCTYVYFVLFMYLFLTLFVYLFMSSSILTIFYRICETYRETLNSLSKPPWPRDPLRVVALWQHGRLAAPLKYTRYRVPLSFHNLPSQWKSFNYGNGSKIIAITTLK